ncbi:Asp23/Gls24 family envelope stress response protein [Uniformispora flossi]|uniref:Asp23/Gls24 family envelope stress response protein n=1 Tax=Uniformispora flossi TaxID=3390723 RepID=UPI003C2EB977
MNTRDDETVPPGSELPPTLPTAAELLAATGGPSRVTRPKDTAGKSATRSRGGRKPASTTKPATAAPASAAEPGAKSAEQPTPAPRHRLTEAVEALGLTESPQAAALRAAADAEPGVRSRSCLIREGDDGKTTVMMSIAVSYGYVLPETAERVRARVKKAVPKILKLRIRDVRIDVRIVWLDEPGAGEAG